MQRSRDRHAPSDAHDLGRLLRHCSQLPGADEVTPLVAVSRSGGSLEGLTVLTPADLLAAWRD